MAARESYIPSKQSRISIKRVVLLLCATIGLPLIVAWFITGYLILLNSFRYRLEMDYFMSVRELEAGDSAEIRRAEILLNEGNALVFIGKNPGGDSHDWIGIYNRSERRLMIYRGREVANRTFYRGSVDQKSDE